MRLVNTNHFEARFVVAVVVVSAFAILSSLEQPASAVHAAIEVADAE